MRDVLRLNPSALDYAIVAATSWLSSGSAPRTLLRAERAARRSDTSPVAETGHAQARFPRANAA